MRQHTIITYSYNELNEKAKEKAHNKVEEIMTDLNFAYFEEDCLDVLKSEYDLQNVNVQYSLSYCQSDGICFDCENLLLSKYIRDKILHDLDEKGKAIFDMLLKSENMIIYSKNNSTHDCCASYSDVDYHYYGCNDAEENFIYKTLLPLIQDIYLSICDKLKKNGYDCYEISNEQFDDFIEFSQYKFLEDGTIYNN